MNFDNALRFGFKATLLWAFPWAALWTFLWLICPDWRLVVGGLMTAGMSLLVAWWPTLCAVRRERKVQ
jgi:hypothetical protein